MNIVESDLCMLSAEEALRWQWRYLKFNLNSDLITSWISSVEPQYFTEISERRYKIFSCNLFMLDIRHDHFTTNCLKARNCVSIPPSIHFFSYTPDSFVHEQKVQEFWVVEVIYLKNKKWQKEFKFGRWRDRLGDK